MTKEELGLVEKLLYEAYKDKAVCSMALFKKKILIDYKIEPSSVLYRKIINYQIKKYGKQLDYDLDREYQQNFMIYSKEKREKNKRNNEQNYQQNRMIERLENEKYR